MDDPLAKIRWQDGGVKTLNTPKCLEGKVCNDAGEVSIYLFMNSCFVLPVMNSFTVSHFLLVLMN